MVWKDAFLKFWEEVQLHEQLQLQAQQGQQLRGVAAIFRPQPERSFRLPPEPAGQDSGAERQRLLPGKKDSSRLQAAESSPS
jgi:hypothetical protein